MSLLQYYDEETHTLSLPPEFNEELKDIPAGTEKIIFIEDLKNHFYSKFNKNVDNLPNTITHLTFGYYFNKKCNNLPNTITHLTFGYNFNKNIKRLPNLITHLTFGWKFNQKVGHMETNDICCLQNLSNSITHLTFNGIFNNNIVTLPNSITHLNLSLCFNKIINNYPTSLVELSFWCTSINNSIPDFIENIIIYFDNNDKYNEYVTNIPPNIKKIKINKKEKVHFISKIPFGCTITDLDDNIIDVSKNNQ
jgi:hypothetical protein